MKGCITICLKEMVEKQFGADKWEKTLIEAGVKDKLDLLLPIIDIDDDIVIKTITSLCKVLKISDEQAADAFGDYWVNVYAPKMYSAYMQNVKTAKEFLLKMDTIHSLVTKNIPNAKPPRFEYKEVDDKTLIIKYKSHRGLIKIFIGLVKGVGKHFNENIKITTLGVNEIEIKWV